MAPFRPSNLNKRAYPGNAGVIGPTTEPTSTTSTATVCSVTTDVCDTCALRVYVKFFYSFIFGLIIDINLLCIVIFEVLNYNVNYFI